VNSYAACRLMCGKASPSDSVSITCWRGYASLGRHSLHSFKPACRKAGGFPHVERQSRIRIAPALPTHDLLFTNYSVPMIGFDRSAFAASPDLYGVRQSKCESSECSIHNEGLPEHPIKNSNRTSVTPSVVSITRTNLNKRFCSGASLQLLFRSSPSTRPGSYRTCPSPLFPGLHLRVSLTGRGRFNSINTPIRDFQEGPGQ
jgi:hypothetical protein